MKPSMLMGNVPWINSLRRAPTDDGRMRFASHSVVDVDSEGAVTGRGPELKPTQEYPLEYCEEVARNWVHQAPELRQSELESDSESDLYDEQSDAWSDAGLEDLESWS